MSIGFEEDVKITAYQAFKIIDKEDFGNKESEISCIGHNGYVFGYSFPYIYIKSRRCGSVEKIDNMQKVYFCHEKYQKNHKKTLIVRC